MGRISAFGDSRKLGTSRAHFAPNARLKQRLARILNPGSPPGCVAGRPSLPRGPCTRRRHMQSPTSEATHQQLGSTKRTAPLKRRNSLPPRKNWAGHNECRSCVRPDFSLPSRGMKSRAGVFGSTPSPPPERPEENTFADHSPPARGSPVSNLGLHLCSSTPTLPRRFPPGLSLVTRGNSSAGVPFERRGTAASTVAKACRLRLPPSVPILLEKEQGTSPLGLSPVSGSEPERRGTYGYTRR